MVSFSRFPLKPDAASKMPFQILGVDERKAFAFLMEVILLETGEHAARKNWQLGQLTNLLQHASSRSQFWRERLGGKKASQIKLSRIPKLTRADLNRQVSEEGALLSEKDGVSVRKNTTSGSTGAPVSFFVSSPNGFYNEVREFAQYIIENRDLRLNRCRFVFDPWHPGYSFQEQSSYAGIFSWLFSTGRNAEIRYLRADLEQIIKKMEVYHPHYFVCLPQFVETMIHNAGTEVFKKIDVRFFVMYGNAISPEVRNASRELSIPIRSSYSCEECGLIGSECTENPGHYHVAESNVIVTPGDEQIEYEGAVCRNVLLTALHSYASPIIRYDVGDFASLAEEK